MGSVNFKTGDTLNLTGTSTVSGATGWMDITPFESGDDDFNNSIYVRGADMHVQSDGKYTTAKDEGDGWVKVNV